MMLKVLPRNRNYRTVPCKSFHAPFKGGFCIKGDICNFIHDERFKGNDIPREELYRIRAENVQKYAGLLQST